MADRLEELTAKLLEEQQAENTKNNADRALRKSKADKEEKAAKKIADEASEQIKTFEKLLKAAKKNNLSQSRIEAVQNKLTKATEQMTDANNKILSMQEDRKFDKKVEAERSKDMQRIDAMKTSVERMKDEAIASGKDASKDRVIKDAEIKIRKEEFDLRVQNLEGTDLMSARLEELGNDLKDKGLDPEKNKEFQKESLNLQRAQLRERLKNAESRSERKEILKEQAAKDKRALSFSQKQMVLLGKLGDKFSDLIPSQEGVATGIFGFLKKAALIGLLLFLPKILNSDMAKDLVQKIEDNLPTIKNGLIALGNFFVDTAKAVGNVALILLDLFTGQWKSAFDRLSTSVTDAFDDNPENENSLIGKLTLIIGALGLFKFAKLLLNIRTLGGIVAGMVGLSNKGIADSGGGGGQDTGKKLSKKNLAKEGLKLNKAGQIVDAKTGKFVSQQRITQAGFKTPVAGDKMKQLSKIGKIGKFLKRIPVLGYILSLGTVAATLMNKDLSGKEKAKRIGSEVGGLAGAGVMAMALSFIPGIGTLVGGMAGYFGGKYLFTKFFEWLLGGSDNKLVEDTTPPSQKGLSGASGGDVPNLNDALPGMAGAEPMMEPTQTTFTGTVSGEQSLALSKAMKSGDKAEIDRIMAQIKSGGTGSPLKLDASNMFPAENAQINQTIIDSSRKTSNSNYTSGAQNVTRNSYGMTNSVFNSI